MSRKAWALKEARAPLVLGFLIFIFNSKHPGAAGARGHLHTNKFSLSKTVQNRTACCLVYFWDHTETETAKLATAAASVPGTWNTAVIFLLENGAGLSGFAILDSNKVAWAAFH